MESYSGPPADGESGQSAQRPQQARQHADNTQDSNWSPLTTPPSVPYPSVSPAHSSLNSSFTRTNDEDYDAQFGYTTVGLGISPSPGHRRVLSQEAFLQESPRYPDTPKTPYQSNDYLLGSPGSAMHPLQADYPHYGQRAAASPPRRWWPTSFGWGWTDSRWVMYALLVFGIVMAISHHVFYSRLDGQPADDQLKMMRFGTLLAYIAKSSLVSAVIFAHRQQIWATVKRRNMKFRTIDDLFASADDLRALVSWELAKKARVALALAIVVWLFPLTVILTPPTLTVAPKTEVDVTQCPSVRTLNFEQEKVKNWRDPGRINGYPGLSLSLWNNTVPLSGSITTPFNDTFFDYWTGSSWQTNVVATTSAFATKAVARDSVAVETCGLGWNCSYVISFTAPGYKCEEVARGRDSNTKQLADMGAPFNTSQLIPDGSNTYLAHTTLGEYSSVQMDAQPGGAPVSLKPPYPKNLGAFRTEPVLWIGHSDQVDPTQPVPTEATDPKWNTSFVPVIFRCEHYVTNYTVQFNHTYSDQVVKVLKKTYLRPIINTTFVPGVEANDGTKDNVTATPESNYIRPLDVESYRFAGAYHSLGLQMRTFINGSLQYTPYVFGNTDALKTRLINKATYLVVPNLRLQIQEFYENMLFSLLSNPQFIVVTWAANATERSGMANASTAADPRLLYPCTRTRTINAYAYRARDLWLVYAFAVVSVVASVFFGALAVAENDNHVRDIKMSSIVAATRAPILEDLPWSLSRWGEVPDDIRDTKVGYGLVVDKMAGTPGTPGGGLQRRVLYGFAPAEVLVPEGRSERSLGIPGTPGTPGSGPGLGQGPKRRRLGVDRGREILGRFRRRH
ncbi:hypothetical protein QBC47DRAFT_99687 [Echria macrotheca]|uniref:Formylmethionine deformylase-like protein n=1 Tax=Echria macrotheca TaxID=438768 RepID=A0AAJ0BLQ5_9PEZI|nr:hypothetical protein QBC47DRAFT_99687 [Echria macrotheca]